MIISGSGGENEVVRSRTVIFIGGILFNPHHIAASYISYNNRGECEVQRSQIS